MIPRSARTTHHAPAPAILLCLGWILWLAACGGGMAQNPYERERGSTTTQIRIHVENRNFADVRIYAVTPSGNRPLGVVGGNGSESFELEWRQLGTLYFRLDFLAGRTYSTPSVNVAPGNQVELQIPANPTDIIIRVR
jgi:hypothetical protein